jgi:hypothetical protein
MVRNKPIGLISVPMSFGYCPRITDLNLTDMRFATVTGATILDSSNTVFANLNHA